MTTRREGLNRSKHRMMLSSVKMQQIQLEEAFSGDGGGRVKQKIAEKGEGDESY